MEVADMVTASDVMPHRRYASLWESIVVDQTVKQRLLWSALLSLQLRAKLPFEATALHGLALLHGTPGTGKTTLARGLAHRLAEMMTSRRTRLIEVNPHGLMSAEHGQSQRKVNDLLGEHIPSLADDKIPTVVLLDEVESMAVARSEASLAANPADVHRATDAVLTALDVNAANHPHLLFVATSNFTGALDAAFLSRADVVIEMPAPDAAAAALILRQTLDAMASAYPPLAEVATDPALCDVAARLAGTDGRRIRKTVTEAMLARFETVADPGVLKIADLMDAASRLVGAPAVPITDAKGRPGAAA